MTPPLRLQSHTSYRCVHQFFRMHRTQHNTTEHNKTQHNTAQHSTAQHSTAQHSTAQHSTAQHSTAQHNTTQHNTAQHSTAQHSTTRHDTTRQNTTQHNTTRGNDCQSYIYIFLLLVTGSKAFKELESVITNKTFLKDIPKLFDEHQTSFVEVLHKVDIYFAPKRTHFFYQGMKAR